MSADFLLEIGCEEIPAWMLPRAQASLKELLEREFQARGLFQGKPVETFATPRRLAAYCARLAAAEPDRVSEVVGPPKSVAYDAQGKPTRAAESFAGKQGVPLSQLKLVATPKGAYMAAVSRQKGGPTRSVLARLLPQLIPQIDFPRTMVWTSAHGLRFIRPIRWLVALCAGQVVEFELAGVRSGRLTCGHRLLSNKAIALSRPGDYQKVLRKAHVLVDPRERREKIRRECEVALRRKRAEHNIRESLVPQHDEERLELVANSVEYPSVVLGEIRPRFMSVVPAVVLETVMWHHQKYFPVKYRTGALVNYFLVVVDLAGDKDGTVRGNHESVLEARLSDAEFFWEADRKRTLADRRVLLKDVVFESRLGNYADKVKRIVGLVRWLGENVSAEGRRADINIAALVEAAELCKSDLTTQLVAEFPELQGVVGALLADSEGEGKREIAAAIGDHYKPAGPEDVVPRTMESALLAIADKLDTIAACFSVGLVPTGSRDPFALRRAGSGIVRIIVERGLRLSLTEAARQAAAVLWAGGLQNAQAADPTAKVQEFLEERARHLFREVKKFPYDEVNAAFAAGWDDLIDVKARLEAIRAIRRTPDFEPIAVAFKRIGNILEQAGGPDRATTAIQNNLIEAGAERELYDRFLKLRSRVAELREKHRYEEALRQIASLRPQVDRYFDTVLVMAKDEVVRENRLALLAHLLREFSTLADFSEIVVRPRGKE